MDKAIILWSDEKQRVVHTPPSGLLICEEKEIDALGQPSWRKISDLRRESILMRALIELYGRAGE